MAEVKLLNDVAGSVRFIKQCVAVVPDDALVTVCCPYAARWSTEEYWGLYLCTKHKKEAVKKKLAVHFFEVDETEGGDEDAWEVIMEETNA